MSRSDFLVILFSTILSFTVLYAPQPLLPLLAAELGVGRPAASLLITVTLLPLSIAPVAYGFMLESVSAKRMLIGASLLLALTSLALALGPDYGGFLLLRLLQGLLLPAMLTALMTYISARAEPARLGQAMAVYVASTVLGGFSGRAFAGLVAEWAGWRTAFLLIGLLLLAAALLLLRLRADPASRFTRVPAGAIGDVLRTAGLGRSYLVIFCAFFVFASLLNFLPFRLIELDPGLGPSAIALMYTGYLMGIAVSLAAERIATLLGSRKQAVVLGLGLQLAATVLFMLPAVALLFANMFLLCAGMFLVHGLLPGLINELAPERRGIVNGLYVGAYYAGGSVGSFAPGLLLAAGGWQTFILGLATVATLALLTAATAPRRSAG
ncbi:MAG: MFS transporter [Xanthomonadaceae bacterium]|nr:MFS transporter [Xanthomonadaceae bacterium]